MKGSPQVAQMLAELRQIDDQMRQSAKHVDTAGQVPNLRKMLQDKCVMVLQSDVHAAIADKVHHRLWNRVFYKRIEQFRRKCKKCSADNNQAKHDNVLRQYRDKMLPEAIAFWEKLLGELLSAARIRLVGPQFVDLLVASGSNKSSDDADSGQMLCALKAASRCLVYLGDLERYTELCKVKVESRRWDRPTLRYQQAIELLPDDGNPHNQLAVLATYCRNKIASVFQYFRSVAVKTAPFSTAHANVATIFSTNKRDVRKLAGAFGFDGSGDACTALLAVLGNRQESSNTNFHECLVRIFGILHAPTETRRRLDRIRTEATVSPAKSGDELFRWLAKELKSCKAADFRDPASGQWQVASMQSRLGELLHRANAAHSSAVQTCVCDGFRQACESVVEWFRSLVLEPMEVQCQSIAQVGSGRAQQFWFLVLEIFSVSVHLVHTPPDNDGKGISEPAAWWLAVFMEAVCTAFVNGCQMLLGVIALLADWFDVYQSSLSEAVQTRLLGAVAQVFNACKPLQMGWLANSSKPVPCAPLPEELQLQGVRFLESLFHDDPTLPHFARARCDVRFRRKMRAPPDTSQFSHAAVERSLQQRRCQKINRFVQRLASRQEHLLHIEPETGKCVVGPRLVVENSPSLSHNRSADGVSLTSEPLSSLSADDEMDSPPGQQAALPNLSRDSQQAQDQDDEEVILFKPSSPAARRRRPETPSPSESVEKLVLQPPSPPRGDQDHDSVPKATHNGLKLLTRSSHSPPAEKLHNRSQEDKILQPAQTISPPEPCFSSSALFASSVESHRNQEAARSHHQSGPFGFCDLPPPAMVWSGGFGQADHSPPPPPPHLPHLPHPHSGFVGGPVASAGWLQPSEFGHAPAHFDNEYTRELPLRHASNAHPLPLPQQQQQQPHYQPPVPPHSFHHPAPATPSSNPFPSFGAPHGPGGPDPLYTQHQAHNPFGASTAYVPPTPPADTHGLAYSQPQQQQQQQQPLTSSPSSWQRNPFPPFSGLG